jgi:hypothetical protein
MLPERRPEITSTGVRISTTKSAKLLRAALTADQTEAAIAFAISKTDSKDPAYKVLKSVTRNRLLNSCFNLTLKRAGYSKYFQDTYRNDRLTFLARILVAIGARQTATLLANAALKESLRLELASNVIENALILRQTALLHGKENQHAHYTEQINHWLGARTAEIQLEGIYDTLRIRYAKRAEPRQGDIDRAIDASEIARSIMKIYSTVNVTLYSYRILTLRTQITKNYEACLQLCSEAEQFIRSRPAFSNPARIAEFAIKRLVCCIHLKDLQQGKQAAFTCAEAYKPGTNNWYVYAEHTFLLYTACLDFESARILWTEITNSYNFLAQCETRKDRWIIFDLYLQLVEGRLSSASVVPFTNAVKFQDFLNKVPTASVDKAGYNFAVIVLHILFLIQQNDWASILDRLEAVKSYRVRHLKTKNSQAALFLQVLADIEKNRTLIRLPDSHQHHAGSLREGLDSSVLEGLQIVPFDYLLSWINQRIAKPRGAYLH